MLRFDPLPDPEDTTFLTSDLVDLFHEEVLLPGQRREHNKRADLLGAVGRPMTALNYDPNCDLVRVAAYYWHGISTSHGYVDGNKRTGFVSAVNFLLMNGVEFVAPDHDLGPKVEQLFLENRFDLDVLEDILRRHCRWL